MAVFVVKPVILKCLHEIGGLIVNFDALLRSLVVSICFVVKEEPSSE